MLKLIGVILGVMAVMCLVYGLHLFLGDQSSNEEKLLGFFSSIMFVALSIFAIALTIGKPASDTSKNPMFRWEVRFLFVVVAIVLMLFYKK